uniref:Hexosyltransferase n=1 Tax=Nomascus leucogenys TaxID=61853 RepID=A0A2I3HA94_NOMLE
MLALCLEGEHLLYGDIMQPDVLDTYNNMTLRTIMAFRWVTEFCPNAKYIMNTDTDKFFTGYPLSDNYSYRGFHQKPHILYQKYPFMVFPPYCSVLGYKMSRGLVHVKPIKFEDVYVGICLNFLKVDIYTPEDTNLFFFFLFFFLFFLKTVDVDVCQLRCVIAAHGFSFKEIITFW